MVYTLWSLAFVGVLLVGLKETTCDRSTQVDEWWTRVSTSYMRYDKRKEFMKDMSSTFPDLVKIYSIGKSVQGREMSVINLRANIKEEREVLQPSMKIVANIHGNEGISQAILLMLVVDLLKGFLKNDARILQLLQHTDLHFVPSLNPDGFEISQEGECNGEGRRNANYEDLNRDFPDQFDYEVKEDEDCEVETLNIMNYIRDNYFVLSLSVHSGSLVAAYPFDSVPDEIFFMPGYNVTQSGFESPSPDNELFVYLANQYARNHKTMTLPLPEACKDNSSLYKQIENGVSNSAKWFNVFGGMQDYNYLHSNCFEFTVELACCKFPASDTLLTEWENNKESLYLSMEATHMGIRGVVKDTDGKPVKHAEITVKGIDHTVKTTERGEYWRLLLPGEYLVTVGAKGYKTSDEMKVEVGPFEVGKYNTVNFKMESGASALYTMTFSIANFIPTCISILLLNYIN